MPLYGVSITATAEMYVQVEADDEGAAEEAAWQAVDLPYFPAGMSGDLGEWETASVEQISD